MRILIAAILAAITIAAKAAAMGCPKDYTQLDGVVITRFYNDLNALQHRDNAAAAADLSRLLKNPVFTDDKLNEAVHSLGQGNILARIGAAYPQEYPDLAMLNRVVPAKDDLLLLALDNPCAGWSTYAAASSVLGAYASAKLSVPVADEMLRKFFNHRSLVDDSSLRATVEYVPFSHSTDAEKLYYYQEIFSFPKAGHLTLNALARSVVTVAPDPDQWLDKILHSPRANSHTAVGVGYGIANCAILPANATSLLRDILASAKPDDGREILEAVTAAIGGSRTPLTDEATLLVRAIAHFTNWATANRGLLNRGYVGKAMANLGASRRRISELAEADAALGSLMAASVGMSEYMNGLVAHAKAGQITEPEFEEILTTIIPRLNKENAQLVQKTLNDAGLTLAPAIQKALADRIVQSS